MATLTQELAEELVEEQGLNVVIPDTYTKIGYSAFKDRKITGITIPDSVVDIDDYAFSENQLTIVDIPDSVEEIGSYAFYGNQISSVEISENITKIEKNAFMGNQLTSVDIPDNVIEIGSSAFNTNQLTSVDIPDNVASIGYSAFFNNLLESIDIPDTATDIGVGAFHTNQLTAFDIPDGVTEIVGYLFYGNQLKTFDIPNGVTKIGEGAFHSNQLESIDIPDGVTEIGAGAFYGNQLTSIDIPDGVIEIGADAFYGNQLTSIDIPDGVTAIAAGVFHGNQLDSIDIPDGVTEIGADAFHGNQLTSIVIPDGVIEIGADAFHGNQLRSISLPDLILQIGSNTFRDNQLTSIEIGDNVTEIGLGAFRENQLTSIKLGSSVETIGSNAFNGNLLTSAYIPDSVANIGQGVFDNNPLEWVSVSEFAPNWSSVFPDGVEIIRRGNKDPTDLFISETIFDENIADGSLVATLSSEDPNVDDIHTYSLVTGDGDTDNTSFMIDGNQLNINSSPNYETYNSYSIRLQTEDDGGLAYEEEFTLTVNDLNEQPTDIYFSNTSFDENIVDGSVVVTISSEDPDVVDNHTYSLIDGNGDTDNSAFMIEGNQLKIITSPSYEAYNSYSIRLQTEDDDGLAYEKEFTLIVNDLNDQPTDIYFSKTSFDENILYGTLVASLSTADLDTNDMFTYSLVSGDGDTDNTAFMIDGNQLKINTSPNYEAYNSYSIRLQTEDDGGLAYEKEFILTVNDLDEQPTDIFVSSTSFDENIADGASVTTFSTVDSDTNDMHTYSLVSGIGDTDNNAFMIVDDSLEINTSPDYESQNSYSIRLQTKDSAGLAHEKSVTLSVNDLTEFDLLPPSISSVYLNYDAELVGFIMKIVVNDDLSGVAEVLTTVKNLSGASTVIELSPSGNSDEFEYFWQLNEYTPSGTWDLAGIAIEDKAGNYKSIADLSDIDVQGSLTIPTKEISDNITPSISKIYLDYDAELVGFKINVLATDDLSGVNQVFGTVKDLDGASTVIELSPSGNSDEFEYFWPLSHYSPAGTWDLAAIAVEDKAGNSNTINDLSDIDIEGTLNIPNQDNIDDWDKSLLIDVSTSIQLINKDGTTYSDASTWSWDAIKAVQSGGGWKVLLEGDSSRDGTFYILDVNASGNIINGSGWETTDQALTAGWESTFGDVIKVDGIIGFPVTDSNADGFVDDWTTYLLTDGSTSMLLLNEDGTTYSDASTRTWDAIKAEQSGDGWKVLLDGDSYLEGKFYVWDVDFSGTITAGSGWHAADQMMKLGYEDIFAFNMNENPVIGI